MIFDGKSIHEISEDEIDAIVADGISERQHLEFKITIDHKGDGDRLETLKDIVSLANGGGGYLIIGIRDKNGQAVRFEPEMVGDVDRIEKSLKSLCMDHIEDRIDGLEVVARHVKGNPIVIVRVPPSSRIPHMATYLHKTIFYSRYSDGKREMTLAEIREAFQKDFLARKLTNIEAAIGSLLATQTESQAQQHDEKIIKHITESASGGASYAPQILSLSQGTAVRDVLYGTMEKEIAKQPFFWMMACPEYPRKKFFDIDSGNIKSLLENPPGSTPNGWNMEAMTFPFRRVGMGLVRGDKRYERLSLFENGAMEFLTPLNTHFCWRQDEEEFKKNPQLYPYAVVEYPVTFLRLYRAILELIQDKENIFVYLSYKNLKGYSLKPYLPNVVGYEFPSRDIIPFKDVDLNLDATVAADFRPDKVAHDEFLRYVYSQFGYPPEVIPCYDKNKEEFNFPR